METDHSARWRAGCLCAWLVLGLVGCSLDGPLGSAEAPAAPLTAFIAAPGAVSARLAPLIIEGEPPLGRVGTPYRWAPVALGAPRAARWTALGLMPEGLHLEGGALEGTPNEAGAFDLLLQVQDGPRSAQRRVRVLIAPGPSTGAPDVDLSGEEPQGMAGFAVAGVGDVTGDGHPDVLLGAPEVWLEGAPGRAWLVEGPLERNLKLPNQAIQLEGVYSGSGAGFAVTGIGDFNGDGARDIAVGAPLGESQHGAGAVFVVFGPLRADMNLREADLRLLGESDGDLAGAALASPGDVDQDGYDDLLIGAPGADRGAVDGGAVYLVRGGPARGQRALSQADAVWEGAAPGEWAGYSLAWLRGPSPMLAVGLLPRLDPEGEPGRGAAAYVLPGVATGAWSLGEAPLTLLREPRAGGAIFHVASAGDTDGDGAEDLLVGGLVSGDRRAVRAACLFQGLQERAGAVKLRDADALFFVEGAGHLSVASAGDVNQDGRADLLIGDPFHDNHAEDAGAAWLALSPLRGVQPLQEATSLTQGRERQDFLGYAVAGPGDLNGDGVPDLLIGAPQSHGPGAALIVYGRAQAQ